MNAVDFIRQSVLCRSGKYAQIRPLVEKVLTDRLTENDLKGLVDTIAPLGTSLHVGVPTEPQPALSLSVSTVNASEPAPTKIKTVRGISETRNVALIKQTPPIELTEGLNIFYGHNGDGKTTLCRAISNCLGLSDHSLDNVVVNIAQPPRVQLVVEDAQGKKLVLAWPSNIPVLLDPVRLFDAELCLALVQDDQDMTFSLAHLKQEYFALLGDALRDLSTAVEERRRLISESLRVSVETIEKTVSDLAGMLPSLVSTQVESASVSEEERKTLKKLEANLQSLEKNELPGKVTTLSSDINHADEILGSLGQPIRDRDGDISDWELTCTESYFQRARTLIDTFNQDSVLLDTRTSTLGRFVPQAWLKHRTWRTFVAAARDFIHSLGSPEQETYRKDKCPYCQQTLTGDSRELLAAYEDVLGDVKSRLDGTTTQIIGVLNDVAARIQKVKTIPYKELLISEEAKCLRGGEVLRLANVLDTLNRLTTSLTTKTAVAVTSQELEDIAAAFSHYRKWRDALIVQRDSYESMAKNKVEEASKLRLQIKPLKHRQLIVDNRVLLRQYLSFRERLTKLNNFRDFLTEAKRQESLLATQFSSQMTIREFQKALDREYDSLGFRKPPKFALECKTSVGSTKRVYTIGDRQFRDVLSEGEQKQHALADFFAQIELEGYSGPLILDDPVTSLDELNTERVARRLVDLNRDRGNQIIVFTHNVFFLNSLLEITHEDKVVHLSKSTDEITVLPGVQLGSESLLKRARNQIQERLNVVEQDAQPNEDALRAVYDLLSRYIETAVEISLLKEVVGRYRPNVRIQSLPRVRWNDAAVGKLVELYNRTSRKGTRHSQPLPVPAPTKDECLRDAEEVLDLVKSL
jgi:energy-coupling factor transporter ATP-binding protein EcfA2